MHEHHPHDHPEKLSETEGPEPTELTTVFLGDAEDAPGEDTPEQNIGVIREGLRRFGEPFLAYLVLDGVEQRSPHLIEEFEASYVGGFPDRVGFTLDRIAAHHWGGAVGEFLERLGLPAGSVRWDYEELFEYLADIYRVTERLGGVYAFRR